MADWALETSEGEGCVRLALSGRPRDIACWTACCRELRTAWPRHGRVELLIEAPGSPGEALASGDPSALVEAAFELLEARRGNAAPLLVDVRGRVSGPWLGLALSAELLLVGEGMAAEALVCEDSRLLTPGELLGVAGRLGRPRALEWGLTGRSITAAELLDSHAALDGDEGRRAWEAARAGSLVAQQAAATLLREREPGRAAFEALERTLFAACFAEGDRAEGVEAFRQKREPDFPSQRDDTSHRGPT